jgi:signal transduction histidine kinase
MEKEFTVKRDTGEIKHARKIIAENETRYRELINNMSNCVAVYRANEDVSDFIIVDFNKAAEKAENVKKEEIIGRGVLSVFPGVKDFGIFDVFHRVWETGVAESFPVSFYKDERITGWRDNYIYKLPSGEVVAIYEDVTERKKTEEKIKLLNTELIDKNNELQQIIYVTSHDLRSPLINIQGFSGELNRSIQHIKKIILEEDNINNMKDSLLNIIDNDIPLSLNYISLSGDKINQLLSGLLKLSRLGRTAMVIKELDINNLVSGLIKTFEFKINELKASIVIDKLPSCYGDETMVIQIFSNLIENAMKNFSPERQGNIRISGYRNKDSSVYCVEDNGKGISQKYYEKIFDIFHKLEPSKEGEGIGLTIVKKIIERHNGKIWVKSELKSGSSFYILLPDIKEV